MVGEYERLLKADSRPKNLIKLWTLNSPQQPFSRRFPNQKLPSN